MTGACLCGDIAFEVEGPFAYMGHCHCSMCRKTHGTAFSTALGAAPDRFRWLRGADGIGRFASSPGGSLREEGEVYADGELVWRAGRFLRAPEPAAV